MATQTTARTLYITTQTGQTIAYRRLGPAHGIPLLMHSEPPQSLSPRSTSPIVLATSG